MDKAEVKRRVEEKVQSGDFFFAEDLARGIAEALNISIQGTPLGQDEPLNSKTRGSIPPFSGTPVVDAEGEAQKPQNKGVVAASPKKKASGGKS